jgi:hypothetical protein
MYFMYHYVSKSFSFQLNGVLDKLRNDGTEVERESISVWAIMALLVA